MNSSSAALDLSKIKPGDEVAVRLYVTEINEHDVWLTTKAGSPAYMDAPVSLIVFHTPKALAVGDRVKWRRWAWEIAAIRDGWAWLVDPTDKGLIVALTELERVQ